MKEELEGKLDEIKSDLITQTRVETLKILSENQQTLKRELHELVSGVFNKNTQILLAKVEKTKFSFKDFLEIFIPSITTLGAVILGYIIWQQQISITRTLSTQEKNLSIQLSLKQKYVDKKFDTYSQVNELLYELSKCAKAVDDEKDSKKREARQAQYADSIKIYVETSEMKKIYMSEGVFRKVFELVRNNTEPRNTRLIESAANEIRQEIKTELEETPNIMNR